MNYRKLRYLQNQCLNERDTSYCFGLLELFQYFSVEPLNLMFI